jgi:4-amino-4-deoxy-L-arabinose transferase-like glycosyltransferase
VLSTASEHANAWVRAARSEPALSSRTLPALVAAITAAGLLLRLPSFSDSLFADELGTYFVVTGHSFGQVIDLARNDQLNPPLYLMVAWVMKELLGDSAQALRLVSFLSGTAVIPLTYLLGLWTVGRRAALCGAALVALSPFLIFYSTEARPYALLLLLDLLSTLALLRALENRRVAWWALYAAASCAAVYTHYPAVFVLAAQFVWAFWTRPDARAALVGANVVAVLVYVPWLPSLEHHTSSTAVQTISNVHPFVLGAVRTDVLHWAIGHPFIALGDLPGAAGLALLAAGAAAGLIGVGWNAARERQRGAVPRPGSSTVLIVLLALAAPVGAAVYSAVGNSVFLPRNLIGSTPALAVAVGLLLTSARAALRIGAVALVVAGLAIGAVKMLEASYQRPDYQAQASYVERLGNPADPVIEAPDPLAVGPFTGFEAALRQVGGRAPKHVLLAGFRPPAAIARRVAQLAHGGRPIFVVTPGAPSSFAALRHFKLSPLSGILQALPPGFEAVNSQLFPGLAGTYPLSAYMLRRTPAPAR